MKNLIIIKNLLKSNFDKLKDFAFLAGGTEINRLNSNVKCNTLVSIKQIKSLRGIKKLKNTLKINSMCTFQEIIESDLVPSSLKNSCYFMASRTKRNMATIGGNIVNNRDDSYLIATLLAYNAFLSIKDVKKSIVKKISLKNYLNKKDIYKNNLITSIIIDLNKVVVNKKYSNTAHSHAYITIAITKSLKDFDVYVTLKGVGTVILNNILKDSNLKDLTDPNIDKDLIRYIKKKIKIKDDFYCSKEYKYYLVGITIVDLILKIKNNKI